MTHIELIATAKNQSLCTECASGYPGEHADACPNNRKPVPAPLPPLEACDCCAARYYASHTKERQPFDAEDHVRKATSMFAKVKGTCCPRCGDNSPKGTWDIAWPERFTLGETATIKLPLYIPNTARQLLHAERAAQKQTKRTRTRAA